jgi:competence protein CoiA
MLRAIRKKDGETVEAWSQKVSSGPFACPSCGGEVILRGGRRRLDHFAHAAEKICRYDLGESENHRRCKAEIWVCLADAPNVADVQLERPLGEVRADVSARINGVPVAIEVQISNLSIADIIRRTKEYERKGIYVLWLAQWKPALDSGRYTPKPWERWLHAAYFGRVYYWLGQTTVVPYHFDPGHVHVPARTWYNPRGNKQSARGYSRRSVRWIRPVRGKSLNLRADFNARDREWWKGGDMEIPPAKLYCDFRAVFWK